MFGWEFRARPWGIIARPLSDGTFLMTGHAALILSVSILWSGGSAPGSKLSTMIMRPPQAGHGKRRILGFVVILDGLVGLAWRRGVEQGTDAIEIDGALAVGEQAIMADSMEPVREDVDQEAPDELEGRNGHDLSPEAAVIAVVLVLEGDAVVVGLDQTIVGDRYPVGIATEISERGGRAVEGLFAVDEPFLAFLSGAR